MEQRERAPRSIPPALRQELLDPDFAECQYCGSTRDLVIDHFLPVAGGGGSHDDNLVAACNRCNAEKLDRTPSEWRAWRMKKGRPWPPPCLDLVTSVVLIELPDEQKVLAIRAIQGWDATLQFEMDQMEDRAWLGRSNPLEDDLKILADCLTGSSVRLARARRYEMGKLAVLPGAFQKQREELEDRQLADLRNARPDDWVNGAHRYQNRVAEQIALIAQRFLSGRENELLRTMLTELDSLAARHQRVVREGGLELAELMKLCGGDTTRLTPSTVDIMKRKMARHVGHFAEICNDEQTRQLRALLSQFADRPLVLF